MTYLMRRLYPVHLLSESSYRRLLAAKSNSDFTIMNIYYLVTQFYLILIIRDVTKFRPLMTVVILPVIGLRPTRRS